MLSPIVAVKMFLVQLAEVILGDLKVEVNASYSRCQEKMRVNLYFNSPFQLIKGSGSNIYIIDRGLLFSYFFQLHAFL